MDRYGIASASYIEIAWTTINAVGALCCVQLLRDALVDRRWLYEQNINGARRLLALESVVGEAIYTVTLAVFALIGVLAMGINSTNANGRPTQLSIFIGVVFIAVALAFTTHAYLRRYWREEYIRRRKERSSGQTTEPPVTITIDTTDVDSVEVTTQVVAKDPDAP